MQHPAEKNSDGFRSRIARLAEARDAPSVVTIAADYHKSEKLDAETALWLLGIARSWHTLGFFEEQKFVCELVLSYLPEYFEAWHLLGFYAQMHGDFARAEDCYARALEQQPDYAFARLALSQIRMMRSGFQGGREDYEARFDAVTEATGPDWRGLSIARWRGESLTGKNIYLWAEQGVGDVMMFTAFLPHLLRQLPARVALGMFPKLIALFERSFPGVAVESLDFAACHALASAAKQAWPQLEKFAALASMPMTLEPLRAAYEYWQKHGKFDYAAPLGDLLIYSMPDYIPAKHPPYMQADAARVAQIKQMLGPGRNIGISWHTSNTREATRNTALADWLPVLKAGNCRFVSLQHGVTREEILRFCRAAGTEIIVPEIDYLQDAEGLAATIAAMDEVVTIDNSVVHMAGALGVPTILLLPVGHNYRWPAEQNQATLWYGSVRVIRQKKWQDWQDAMLSVAEKLQNDGFLRVN